MLGAILLLGLLSCTVTAPDNGSTDTGDCAEPTEQTLDEPCAAFAATETCPWSGGQHWETRSQLECGLSQDECGTWCYWLLDVDSDGSWTWQGSDYGDGGTWSCDSGGLVVLSGQGEGARQVEWSFAPATCVLTWDSVDYLLLAAD